MRDNWIPAKKDETENEDDSCNEIFNHAIDGAWRNIQGVSNWTLNLTLHQPVQHFGKIDTQQNRNPKITWSHKTRIEEQPKLK